MFAVAVAAFSPTPPHHAAEALEPSFLWEGACLGCNTMWNSTLMGVDKSQTWPARLRTADPGQSLGSLSFQSSRGTAEHPLKVGILPCHVLARELCPYCDRDCQLRIQPHHPGATNLTSAPHVGAGLEQTRTLTPARSHKAGRAARRTRAHPGQKGKCAAQGGCVPSRG